MLERENQNEVEQLGRCDVAQVVENFVGRDVFVYI